MTNFKELKGLPSVKNTVEKDKWQYQTMGFSASTGDIYMGDDTPDSITGVIMALRQCKEVNIGSIDAPITKRYHIFTKKTDMVQSVDKVQQRVQALILIDGTIYNFGCKSWTSRALFVNPLDEKYHDAKYKAGLWPSLLAHIKDGEEQEGVETAPSSWLVTIKKGPQVKNDKSGGNMQSMTWEGFEHVGADAMIANDNLYTAEELNGWVKEWATAGGQIADAEFTPDIDENSADDIDAMMKDVPGFDL